MKHTEYFDVIVLHSVGDNVGQGSQDKLTRSLDSTGPPDIGIFNERFNALADQKGYSVCSLRFVRRNIFPDFNEIEDSFIEPSYPHCGGSFSLSVPHVASHAETSS